MKNVVHWAHGSSWEPCTLYDPTWEHEPKALAKDFASHLVHGLAIAGAYRALDALVRRGRA